VVVSGTVVLAYISQFLYYISDNKFTDRDPIYSSKLRHLLYTLNMELTSSTKSIKTMS
jgi:hypothetical protein